MIKTSAPVFVTFNRNTVKIHNATNGTVIATKIVPIQSHDRILDANSDATGKYITVSCSNRSIFVYKQTGTSSWSVYKQYTH